MPSNSCISSRRWTPAACRDRRSRRPLAWPRGPFSEAWPGTHRTSAATGGGSSAARNLAGTYRAITPEQQASPAAPANSSDIMTSFSTAGVILKPATGTRRAGARRYLDQTVNDPRHGAGIGTKVGNDSCPGGRLLTSKTAASASIASSRSRLAAALRVSFPQACFRSADSAILESWNPPKPPLRSAPCRRRHGST